MAESRFKQARTLFGIMSLVFTPEGNLGDEYTVFFQAEEIEKVNYIGLSCKADDRMQEVLNNN